MMPEPVSEQPERIAQVQLPILVLLVAMLLVASLTQGCAETGKNAGEAAANILARDVVPKVTQEFEQWRGLANSALQELPQQFRQEFDLAFSRAISAVGTEARCETEFIRSRLIQDLEALRAKWLGTGPGPSPQPHFCTLYPPGEVIELDANDRPMTQGWVTYSGYDFADYNNQLLVRVWLEDTSGGRQDISQCCLDNPTHYNITVDFDEVDFTEARRLVLTSPSGQTVLKTVGINHPPPAAPVAVLSAATVQFYTTDDDKDGDTLVNVHLMCAGSTLATASERWERFPDNTSSGMKSLAILLNAPKATFPGDCQAELVEAPNGHDEWHFNWTMQLTFSDQTMLRYDFPDGNVDYDRTTQRWSLNP